MAVDNTKLVDFRFGWRHYTGQKTRTLVAGDTFDGVSVTGFESANMKDGDILVNVSGTVKKIKIYGFDSITSTSGTAPLTTDYVADDILVKDNASDKLYKVSVSGSTYSKAEVIPGSYKGLVAERFTSGDLKLIMFEIDDNKDTDNLVKRN